MRARRLKLNEKDVSTLRTALEKKNQRMDTQVIPVLRWSEDTIDTNPEGQALELAEDEPRRSRAAAVAGTLGKVLVSLASVIALITTGVAWAAFDQLSARTNTSDVIGAVAPSVPDDGATDILLVGSDSRTDAQGNPLPDSVLKELRTEISDGLNTDTIIVLRVPHNGSKAYAISIPRDSYVTIPGYRDDKINATYGAIKGKEVNRLRATGMTDEREIEQQSDAVGRKALREVVEDLTGQHIDHYAEVNLYGFYLLTNAIGGVDVCLKQATKDKDSGANFKAGEQNISGGEALSFVRQRENLPRGDLDRIVRQQVFMAAAAKKVLSAGTLTSAESLRGLVETINKAVVLDSGWDLLGFAGQMRNLTSGAVEFTTIPVVSIDGFNDRGQSIVKVDKSQVKQYVDDLMAGRTPQTSTMANTSSLPPTTSTYHAGRSKASVQVLNASSKAGVATRVTAKLKAAGLNANFGDSTALKPSSVIRVAKGEREPGEQISSLLGGIPVVEDAKQDSGSVTVILGGDYKGPGANPGFGSGPRLALDGDDSPRITPNGIPCVN
ncbi:LytR family transcriptional regulator [Pseudonocardiaceae bacterium YIM PH 21723]|nr:LytR family transcriptional regulator [Pseudonocardiaceae bacterium YIM PH 21723]